MEKLVTVEAMKERYGLKSTKTARKYIKQFPFFYENPLTAPLWALQEWEESRAVVREGTSSKKRTEMFERQKSEQTLVPRKR